MDGESFKKELVYGNWWMGKTTHSYLYFRSDFDMRLVQLTLMGLLYQNIVLLRHYSHLLLQWRSILAIKYVGGIYWKSVLSHT